MYLISKQDQKGNVYQNNYYNNDYNNNSNNKKADELHQDGKHPSLPIIPNKGVKNILPKDDLVGKLKKSNDASVGGSGRNVVKTKKIDRKGNNDTLTEIERKDEIISSLEYRVEILQKKINKLEQLLSLKDSKIQYLESVKKA